MFYFGDDLVCTTWLQVVRHPYLHPDLTLTSNGSPLSPGLHISLKKHIYERVPC